jgi:hypothetical protein
VRCIGDPFGPGCDCLAPAKGFGFGAIPNYDDGGRTPMIVAMPFCDEHALLVLDWLSQSSPLKVEAFNIEMLSVVQERMAEQGDELWLYTSAAA